MKYIGVSTPAWTIIGDSGRHKLKNIGAMATNDLFYNVDDKLANPEAPKWSFSKDKNKSGLIKHSNNPILGPGSYYKAHKSTKVSASAKMLRPLNPEHQPRRFKEIRHANRLVPHSYDVNDLKKAPKFSFGYKLDHNSLNGLKSDNDLGPGYYYSGGEAEKLGSTGISFSKGPREDTTHKKKLNYPGPDRYFKTPKITKNSFNK